MLFDEMRVFLDKKDVSDEMIEVSGEKMTVLELIERLQIHDDKYIGGYTNIIDIIGGFKDELFNI